MVGGEGALHKSLAGKRHQGVAVAGLHVTLHDPAWERIYAPVAGAVRFGADRLNRVQFMTIRRYLTFMFSALILLLLVVALWQ